MSQTLRSRLKRHIPDALRPIISRALGRSDARWYIPEGLSIEDFFERLRDADAHYVVLRWFENLPVVAPGEDIDILVADGDLDVLTSFLRRTGKIPCDIYSVSGLRGSSYKSLAYFPTRLANSSLENRTFKDGLFAHPSLRDYFFGLAYHAVYQKGPVSGLPTSRSDVVVLERPDHDYAGVLSRLAADLGFDVAMDLEGLDEFLARHGYRPEQSSLEVLRRSNPWVDATFFADRDAPSASAEPPRPSSAIANFKAAATRLPLLAAYRTAGLVGRRADRAARLFNGAQRMFIRPELGGTSGLLAALNKQDVRYLILRADPDPTAAAADGRPFAFLFDDKDIGAVRNLLTPWPVGPPCAAYSAGGLPGFAFGGMALLPPRLARRLLASAHDAGGIRVADPQQLFFAAIYASIYLPGSEIGIFSRKMGDGITLEEAPIRAGAGVHDVTLPDELTWGSLDALLAKYDWSPPLDVLERIAPETPWIARKLEQEGHGPGAHPPGLAAFFLRRNAADRGMTAAIHATIGECGFSILPTPPLSDEELRLVADEVRGGNWGRGPFAVSGGEPASVFLAYDPNPLRPTAKTLAAFPLLDNERIVSAKKAVRDATLKGLPKKQHYNALHSTDNATQAWRMVDWLFSAHKTDIEAGIANLCGRAAPAHAGTSETVAAASDREIAG